MKSLAYSIASRGDNLTRRTLSCASFTLVELLVVIAIISILAALLLPTLKSAHDQSLTANCMSNLRQLGTVSVNYCNEFPDYIAPQNIGISTNYCWDYQYGKLFLDYAVEATGYPSGQWPLFRCPADPTQIVISGTVIPRRESYGLIYAFTGRELNGDITPAPRISRFPILSATYMIADVDYQGINDVVNQKTYKNTRVGENYSEGNVHLNNSYQLGPNHQNAANILYLDSHCSLVELWKYRFEQKYYTAINDTVFGYFTE